MPAPPLAPNEEARLAALRALEILDTEHEGSYEDIVRLAAFICQTPASSVTLVDAARQWFKASVGLAYREDTRDVSFCAHAILAPDETTVVRDARDDPRFADNPLVQGEPFIRFYAGAPLVLSSGEALGTLCVFDYTPREMSAAQQEALEALARRVMDLLEARRTVAALARALLELQRTHVARPMVRRIVRELLLVGSIRPETLQSLGKKLADDLGTRDITKGAELYANMGLGHLDPPVTEGALVRITGSDTVEHRADARTSTCYLTLGFLTGIVPGTAGSEVACQSRGDPSCTFVLRPSAP